MVVLIIAGLVVLLVVLAAVRSAQNDATSPRHQTTATSIPSIEPENRSTTTPPLDASVVHGHSSAEHDYYLWESQRIASRGESRAGSLDFFGYIVSGLAALVVLGAFLAAVNDELTTDERVVVILGACGAIFGLVAIAAIFFGFGALVRNSSRSLAISAGNTLDSFEPPD